MSSPCLKWEILYLLPVSVTDDCHLWPTWDLGHLLPLSVLEVFILITTGHQPSLRVWSNFKYTAGSHLSVFTGGGRRRSAVLPGGCGEQEVWGSTLRLRRATASSCVLPVIIIIWAGLALQVVGLIIPRTSIVLLHFRYELCEDDVVGMEMERRSSSTSSRVSVAGCRHSGPSPSPIQQVRLSTFSTHFPSPRNAMNRWNSALENAFICNKNIQSFITSQFIKLFSLFTPQTLCPGYPPQIWTWEWRVWNITDGRDNYTANKL